MGEVFSERRDADGLSRREVSLDANGCLVIEGHDLGPGVEEHFGPGCTEYEFTRTVAAPDVERVRALLGIQGDLLPALKARFETTFALERWLTENAIPTAFWNRIGD